MGLQGLDIHSTRTLGSADGRLTRPCAPVGGKNSAFVAVSQGVRVEPPAARACQFTVKRLLTRLANVARTGRMAAQLGQFISSGTVPASAPG